MMWCRAVLSDPLAEQLDPEELYELIQAAHDVCGGVIHRFEGHIAQRFGDGLMVYFGYPRAHEDDAYREEAPHRKPRALVFPVRLQVI